MVLCYLRAQARLDQWNAALDLCYAEIHRLAHIGDDVDRNDIDVTSTDLVQLSKLEGIAMKHMAERYADAIDLLESKPFGLPLNAHEKRMLATAQKNLTDFDKPSVAAATPGPASAPLPPQPTPEEIEAERAAHRAELQRQTAERLGREAAQREQETEREKEWRRHLGARAAGAP